jgi:hypothetical protein
MLGEAVDLFSQILEQLKQIIKKHWINYPDVAF